MKVQTSFINLFVTNSLLSLLVIIFATFLLFLITFLFLQNISNSLNERNTYEYSKKITSNIIEKITIKKIYDNIIETLFGDGSSNVVERNSGDFYSKEEIEKMAEKHKRLYGQGVRWRYFLGFIPIVPIPPGKGPSKDSDGDSDSSKDSDGDSDSSKDLDEDSNSSKDLDGDSNFSKDSDGDSDSSKDLDGDSNSFVNSKVIKTILIIVVGIIFFVLLFLF